MNLDVIFQGIDAINREDRAREQDGSTLEPRDWLYGVRMSAALDKLAPDASLALKVACRAQHLARHRLPRDRYPMNREGYLRWRRDQARAHAELLEGIMRDAGAADDEIARATSIVQKKKLRKDEEAQILEDVACLVFLEHYAADFATEHPRQKVIDIVQKTWRKMGARGQAAAGAWPMPEGVRALVAEALKS